VNTDEPIPEPAFAAFLAARGDWSRSTRELCQTWLDELHRFLDVPWQQVRAQHLKQFEAHLQWGGRKGKLYSANTVYQAVRMVRSFYRWAKVGGLVAADPTTDWVLSRPRIATVRLLTQIEVLQLFNLPDLATPLGQRDVLMLALLFHGNYSLERCRTLRCGELAWNVNYNPTLKSAHDRYFQQGRAQIDTKNQPILLLTDWGEPLGTDAALKNRLKALGQQIGHPRLSHRVLLESRNALELDVSQRRLRLL